MSRTIKVSFEISEERFLEALKLAGEDFSLELKKDINLETLSEQFSEDVGAYIYDDLAGYLSEGINNDQYLDFFVSEE